MKRYFLIIILFFVYCFLVSCASTIQVQPHVSSVSISKMIGDEAGIYISPLDLSKVHTQSSILGGEIRVPLGSPLKDCSQESFSTFFKRVFFTNTNDSKTAEYIVEVSLSNFNVTGGLDTHLTIMCSISKSGTKIFSGDFQGSGSGTAAAGFLGEALAREQIRKSCEEAFIDAFKKAQTAIKEFISKNN